MGETRGKNPFYPKNSRADAQCALPHGRFGARGGQSASVFAVEAGKMAKTQNTNVLQKNGDKNSEKH